MKMHPDYKSCFKILKGGKISLVVSALLGATTISFAAPSGGVVTSGNATISQNGTTTNINQSTQKATINWQKFSVASNETVNFNQPNVNSITLNRVIGNEKSIINGALNANGQVWILNSNGVLFGKNASINTAGLLATTAQLSDTDFNAGNYHFKDATANSVINEGTITISDAGSVILASNEVRNQGTIKAIKGKVHLVGASEYTVNLNGNSLVNLKVNKGVLDALVENSGHIIADGGEIYLTTNAVNELLKGVVNNTGIIEANSLDGLTGHVELFAHGGEVQVGGTIKAKDGFVETSGKEFIFNGADIQAGEWLIDPTDIYIRGQLAYAITTQLQNFGNVTITTNGGNTPDTSSGEMGLIGSIYFVDAIINPLLTTERTLTLKAHRNIEFQAGKIEATGNALNVYLSTANSNTASSAGFSMYSNSSIKTNGGDIIIGGALVGGLPSFTTQYANSLSHEITGNSILDAGSGNITIAMTSGTAWAQSGRFTLDDNSELKANNINFKTLKSTATSGDETSDFGINLDITGNSLVQATGDITVDSEKTGNVDFTLEDSILQADGDITINAQRVTAELNEDDGVIKIIADNLAVDATDEIEITDTVIKVNNSAEFSAADNIDLSDSQILFENEGTLTINAYTNTARQNYIDYLISDWDAVDEAELLDWINEDEGTSYATMDEYLANNAIYKPMLVDLKGGDYTSTLFSDGTPTIVDTSTLPILNNDLLAFGDGLSSSITDYGMLKQPLYYNETDERWYKLTYSNYPMDIMIGVGGSSYNDGDLYDTGGEANSLQNAVSNLSLDLSGYANNTGTIKVNMDVTTSAGVLPITQSYTLEDGTTFVKATTSITNNTGSTVDNARLWIGTQDDYVALSDDNFKTRGNIGENGFEAVTDQTSDVAKALIVSENALDSGNGAAVLFYSTTNGTNTIVSDDYGWGNIIGANPSTMPDVSTSAEDGSYALYLNLGAFSNQANGSVTWYYAAAPVSEVGDMVSEVSQSSAGVTPSKPTPAPTPTTNNNEEVNKVVTAIVNTNVIKVQTPKITPPVVQPQTVKTTITPPIDLGFGEGTKVSLVSKPLEGEPSKVLTLSDIRAMQTASPSSETGRTQQENNNNGFVIQETRVALSSDSIVDLVNGGVNLPEGVEQEFYVVEDKRN